MSEYHGTITSKLKPIVTMLTEALVRDFAPAYRRVVEGNAGLWVRTAEDGTETAVDDEQLKKDVEAWLLNLEHEMDNDSDRQFAKMSAHMIRKNKGWVTLLTNRVIRRLRQ
jgi:hypothetical protein